MITKTLLSPNKILVIKRRAMGDSLMGLGAISYLKEIFPKSHISYALPRWIIPLYEKVKTPADDYIPIDLHNIKDVFSLTQKLFTGFDLIYEFHQSGRTRKFFNMYSKISGIPYGFHNHHLRPDLRGPAIQRDLEGLHLFLKERGYISGESVEPSYLHYTPVMKTKVSQKNPFLVVLGVTASRATKCWPLQSYKELCEELLKKDARYEFIVPLSQNKFDQNLILQMKKLNFPSSVKITQFSLSELPELVAPANFYVGNDTGLKHLCVALGIKTYTFFGPEEPLEWHPYDEKKHPYYFLEPLACRTQTHHYCGLSHCESMICLNSLSAKDFLENFLLKETANG